MISSLLRALISATLSRFCQAHVATSLHIRLPSAVRPLAMEGPACSDAYIQADRQFGGGLADLALVDRLHDAVLHEHVFKLVHGDRGRDDALAAIGVDFLARLR